MIFIDDIAVYICDHGFLKTYVAIKKNKTNMGIYLFRKARNGKLIICDGKLIIMH